MKRKTLILMASLAVVAGVFAFVPAPNVAAPKVAQDEPPQQLSKFMQLKLEYAKEILAGLTLNDHEKVAKNSQALSLLSLESNWNVLNTEEYLEQSRDFRASTKVITEAAREKNIERATLGYVTMTVRCVECHRYLRDRK